MNDRKEDAFVLGISCFYHDSAACLLRDGELLAAAQGVDFHRPLLTSAPLQRLHTAVRDRVDFHAEDRYLAPDLRALDELLRGNLCRELCAGVVADLLPSLR